jgi:CPA2 family monovalent cation:H+ antiporter-2
MHLLIFLQDLAFIMMVAGIVTILCHQFKQPVILGYITAGIILGPHVPALPIHDKNAVKTLAEIGVIFLMFSLGLEFSIRRLFRVGGAALSAAIGEIVFMMLIGYGLGQLFGWSSIDSLFLGAMIAISSTTIIIKALHELHMQHEKFAQLIFGILIIEDILAIAMLTLLSSLALTGSIHAADAFTTLGQLLVFLVAALVIGIATVPKLLAYVSHFKSEEMLLITVLGLCFGFCLLVTQLGYSVALGAFLIGAVVAESRNIKMIEKLVAPLTDMFSAIFFVSIGLLVNPNIIITYIIPILIITFVVVVGKILTCGLGTFLAGKGGITSMRVGMGVAQIGEFSFIIASLGISLKVTSDFLYPIIVAVSAITTLLTPYLIKAADPFAHYLVNVMPSSVSEVFNLYTTWLQNIQRKRNQTHLNQAIQRSLLQIVINLILVIGIFILGSYISHTLSVKYQPFHLITDRMEKTLIWSSALILSIPFLIAIYRKLKELSLMLAELTVKNEKERQYNLKLRRIICEIIPIIAIVAIMLILAALSASILPPLESLILILFIACILTAVLWHWFIKFHTRLQTAFLQNFQTEDKVEDKA